MRTYEEIIAHARREDAFSNGTERQGWMDRWCGHCVHDTPEIIALGMGGCPLVKAMYERVTPSEWFEHEGPRIDQYVCVEFRSVDGEQDSAPTPQPDVPEEVSA